MPMTWEELRQYLNSLKDDACLKKPVCIHTEGNWQAELVRDIPKGDLSLLLVYESED